MHRSQSRPISEHRLARFTAWLAALLAWLALGVCGEGRYRRRQFGIGVLRRGVRNLIIVHAAKLIAPPKPSRLIRAGVPFIVCARRRRGRLRSIAGVWLRKRLSTRGSFVTQVKHLLAVLRRVRSFAVRLAHRRRAGLSRLISIVPSRPTAAALPAAPASALASADTS